MTLLYVPYYPFICFFYYSIAAFITELYNVLPSGSMWTPQLDTLFLVVSSRLSLTRFNTMFKWLLLCLRFSFSESNVTLACSKSIDAICDGRPHCSKIKHVSREVFDLRINGSDEHRSDVNSITFPLWCHKGSRDSGFSSEYFLRQTVCLENIT